MKINAAICSLLVSLLATALPVSGQQEGQIFIPVGSQGNQQTEIEIPQKGQTQQSVLEQFGEPIKRSAAIGEPPITHWQYREFTVYFENNHAIHAVRQHHAKETQSGD